MILEIYVGIKGPNEKHTQQFMLLLKSFAIALWIFSCFCLVFITFDAIVLFVCILVFYSFFVPFALVSVN